MSFDAGLAPAPAGTAGGQTESRADPKPAARIGDRLLELRLITFDQLEVALFEQKRSGHMLGTVLVDLGFISNDVLTSLLAESSGYEQFDPKTALVDPEVVTSLPKEVALRHRVVPLSSEGSHVFVAMCDPYDVLALDQLRRQLGNGVIVVPRVCPPAAFGELIDRAYGYAMSIDGILRELETGEAELANLDAIKAGYAHPAGPPGRRDPARCGQGRRLRHPFRARGAVPAPALPDRRRAEPDPLVPPRHWPAISQRMKIVAGHEHRRQAPARRTAASTSTSAIARSTCACPRCRPCTARTSSCACSTRQIP